MNNPNPLQNLANHCPRENYRHKISKWFAYVRQESNYHRHNHQLPIRNGILQVNVIIPHQNQSPNEETQNPTPKSNRRTLLFLFGLHCYVFIIITHKIRLSSFYKSVKCFLSYFLERSSNSRFKS